MTSSRTTSEGRMTRRPAAHEADPNGAAIDFKGEPAMTDAVHHPAHYTSHPSGIECITVTEHMGFNLGNAIEYVWRADLKADAIEDMRKAIWYIEREIQKRERT